MPHVEIKDGLGIPVPLHEFNGKYFPRFPVLEEKLKYLPDMPCRDDDVFVLTYPKAGTNWTWEIVNLLHVGDGGTQVRNKTESVLEMTGIDTMANLPSARLFMTHLTPEFFPKDLINRKCKIVFVQRNPKDAYVSFFHFARKISLYKYEDGEWNGFFDLIMSGKNAYGPWFDFTKQWEDFFTQHPDIPVLRLYFEDMKLDLPSEIERTAQFLDLPCNPSYRDKVAEKCGFEVMKNWHKTPQGLLNKKHQDDPNALLRKGIVGDWKNHFTVAQNERFDAEYKKQMKGFTFKFEQYM